MVVFHYAVTSIFGGVMYGCWSPTTALRSGCGSSTSPSAAHAVYSVTLAAWKLTLGYLFSCVQSCSVPPTSAACRNIPPRCLHGRRNSFQRRCLDHRSHHGNIHVCSICGPDDTSHVRLGDQTAALPPLPPHFRGRGRLFIFNVTPGYLHILCAVKYGNDVGYLSTQAFCVCFLY